MFRSENQETFALVLKAFSEAARENYKDHAFEAGYLQSFCVQLLGMVPKKYQRSLIDDMVRATKKQEQQVIEKRESNQTFERV